MTDTWLCILPVIASVSWLGELRDSGWEHRPAPDPEAFARIRDA